jgi:hypothetical protein
MLAEKHGDVGPTPQPIPSKEKNFSYTSIKLHSEASGPVLDDALIEAIKDNSKDKTKSDDLFEQAAVQPSSKRVLPMEGPLSPAPPVDATLAARLVEAAPVPAAEATEANSAQ